MWKSGKILGMLAIWRKEMEQDLEREKEDLLQEIDQNIDPKLRNLLATINIMNAQQTKIKVVLSTEGTSHASTK